MRIRPRLSRLRLAVSQALIALLLAGALPSALHAATWSREAVDTVGVFDHGKNDVAVDRYGDVHALYLRDGEIGWDLVYARRSGSSWETETVGEGNGNMLSLAVDSTGSPHVAFGASANGTPYYVWRDPDGVWTWEALPVALAATGMSIVVDEAGNPHIGLAGWDGYLDHSVMYLTKVAGNWTVEPLETLFAQPFPTPIPISIALDPQGAPQLAYDSPFSELTYAEGGAGGWTTETVPGSFVYAWLSLDVDLQGRAHLCTTPMEASDILHLVRETEGWTQETVASGWLGDYDNTDSDCFRLDGQDRPQVLYLAGTPGEHPALLMRARRTAGGWVRDTVDSAADVAYSMSLGIGPDSRAHALYVVCGGGGGGACEADGVVYARELGPPGAPDPGTSTVPCLTLCPGGDMDFTVTVRDGGGTPVPNAKVVVSFANCPAVHLCLPDGSENYGFEPGRYIISGLTNASGVRTFGIRGCGTSSDLAATVTAQGVLLGTRAVASPDQDGSFTVGVPDFGLMQSKLGTADRSADFDCSGLVNTADLAAFAAHFSGAHQCQSAVNVGPAPDADRVVLHPCEPQPSRGSTTLRFDLPVASTVRLRILDLAGREVRVIVEDARLAAGSHARHWDVCDGSGEGLRPGTYVACLEVAGRVWARKIVLLR